MCSNTDGDRQLVARDPNACWLVVEQRVGEPARVLRQERAEGEVAYFLHVLGNPCWLIDRGSDTDVHVFTDDRPTPMHVVCSLEEQP